MKIIVRVYSAEAMVKLAKKYTDIKETHDPEEGCLTIQVPDSSLAVAMSEIAKIDGVKTLICDK